MNETDIQALKNFIAAVDESGGCLCTHNYGVVDFLTVVEDKGRVILCWMDGGWTGSYRDPYPGNGSSPFHAGEVDFTNEYVTQIQVYFKFGFVPLWFSIIDPTEEVDVHSEKMDAWRQEKKEDIRYVETKNQAIAQFPDWLESVGLLRPAKKSRQGKREGGIK